MLPVGSRRCEAGGEIVQSRALPPQITAHSLLEAMREKDQPIMRRGRLQRRVCRARPLSNHLARGQRSQPLAQPVLGIGDAGEVERRLARLLAGALRLVRRQRRGGGHFAIIEAPIIAICPPPLIVLLGRIAVRPEFGKAARHVGRVLQHEAGSCHDVLARRLKRVPLDHLVDGDRQDDVGQEVDRERGVRRPVHRTAAADRLD